MGNFNYILPNLTTNTVSKQSPLLYIVSVIISYQYGLLIFHFIHTRTLQFTTPKHFSQTYTRPISTWWHRASLPLSRQITSVTQLKTLINTKCVVGKDGRSSRLSLFDLEQTKETEKYEMAQLSANPNYLPRCLQPFKKSKVGGYYLDCCKALRGTVFYIRLK